MDIQTQTIVLQVGVKAFIKNAEGKYLFLKRVHAYEGNTEPKWDIPGGRINPGEELLVALKREIFEETGLELIGEPRVLFAQDILRNAGKHTVRVTYAAQVAEGGQIVLASDEHSEFRWVTLEEAQNLYHDTYLDPVLALRRLKEV